MRGSRALCALVALLPVLAFAAPAAAGTASISGSSDSVAGDGGILYLNTQLAPGEPDPSVRVHYPGQPTACSSPSSDPGATIAGWLNLEGTTVQSNPEVGSWIPQIVGTYAFCVYFADATSLEIDRQVVAPLTYTLAVTPGPPGSPSAVSLDGAVALAFGQTMGIELKYRAAGGLPCSPSPATEPGAPLVLASSGEYHYLFVEPVGVNRDVSLRVVTPPLAEGTYLLCMWESAIGSFPDLTGVTLSSSTTFVVASAPTTPTPGGGTAPNAPAARSLPRSLQAPSLVGRFRVGSLLRCGTGRWSSSPTISAYRWYRGTTRVARASSATYRVTRRDGGRRLHCQAVATVGNRSAISRPSASHAIAKHV